MDKMLLAFSNQFKMVEKNPNATRSTAITLELHSRIHDVVESLVDSEYQIHSQKNKEISIKGAFLSKKADIAIVKGNEVIGAIEVKAIRSSYKKNATNYFYNMIGETSNLQTANIPVCQVILIPSIVQTRSAGKTSYETIGDTQLQKYLTLSTSEDNPSKPKGMIVSVLDVDYEDSFNCAFSTLENFSSDMKDFLTLSGSDISKSIETFVKEEVLNNKGGVE